MFDGKMELITQATSNSLFIFCFFNLIIAILLIGSLKPSSYSDQETALPFAVVSNVQKNEKEDLMDANGVSDAQKGMVVDVNQEKDLEDNNSLEEEEKEEEEEEEEEGDDDNDELRRRAEEFIEKINSGWRAEMLRTASLIQTENFRQDPEKFILCELN